MTGVETAVAKFLRQTKPQPSLVISDPDVSAEDMKEMGFSKQGDYWVISRADARKIFEVRTVDFDKHWKEERKFRQQQF